LPAGVRRRSAVLERVGNLHARLQTYHAGRSYRQRVGKRRIGDQELSKPVAVTWCTPNLHKVHRSNEPAETDSNYGNILSIYDRAFGTFTNTDRARHVVYGLKGADGADARSFTWLLSRPFGGDQRERQRAEMARESS
jgi:hypothetical protein